MITGVDHTKKTLLALGELTCDVISIVRDGAGFGSIKKAFEVLSEAKILIQEAPLALPELADLDAKECADLGAIAYSTVKRIVESIKAI